MVIELGNFHQNVNQQPDEAVVAFRLGCRIAGNLTLEPELESEEDRQGDQDEHCSRVKHKPQEITKSGESPGDQGEKTADDQAAAASGSLLLILISHSVLSFS